MLTRSATGWTASAAAWTTPRWPGIAYQAGSNGVIGQIAADVRVALRGDNRLPISAARAPAPLFSASQNWPQRA